MEWIKRNNKLFLVLCIIGCFLIPIIINIILSYNLIPSIGTDSGEWLGFWGSFLGSIIGGLTTILGVLYTINQMKSEKKDREKVKIIPLKSSYYRRLITDKGGIEKLIIKNKFKNFLIDEEIKKNNELYKKTNEVKFKLREIELINKTVPNVRILNVSDNVAVEVKLEWEKPLLEEINEVFKQKAISLEEYDLIENVMGNKLDFFVAPIIKGGQNAIPYKIFLYSEIQELIDLISKKYEEIDECLFGEIFPMGTFIIKFKDIYGKEDKCIVKIIMNLTCYLGNGQFDFELRYQLLDK